MIHAALIEAVTAAMDDESDSDESSSSIHPTVRLVGIPYH